MKGEVREPVSVPQIGFLGEARRAQIDPRDASFGVIEGVASSGVAPAPRDQDVEILSGRLVRPERVKVLPEVGAVPDASPTSDLELLDGERVDPFLVLLGHRAVVGRGAGVLGPSLLFTHGPGLVD